MPAQPETAHSGMLWRDYTDSIDATLRGFMATVYRPDGTTLAQESFPVVCPDGRGYDAAAGEAYAKAKEWLSLWGLESRR